MAINDDTRITLGSIPDKQYKIYGINFYKNIFTVFPNITAFEVLIIQVLDCYRYYDTPICNTYVKQIAEVLRCDKGTVSNSMDSLHNKGIIIKSKVKSRINNRMVCNYDLTPLITKLWELEIKASQSEENSRPFVSYCSICKDKRELNEDNLCDICCFKKAA